MSRALETGLVQSKLTSGSGEPFRSEIVYEDLPEYYTHCAKTLSQRSSSYFHSLACALNHRGMNPAVECDWLGGKRGTVFDKSSGQVWAILTRSPLVDPPHLASVSALTASPFGTAGHHEKLRDEFLRIRPIDDPDLPNIASEKLKARGCPQELIDALVKALQELVADYGSLFGADIHLFHIINRAISFVHNLELSQTFRLGADNGDNSIWCAHFMGPNGRPLPHTVFPPIVIQKISRDNARQLRQLADGHSTWKLETWLTILNENGLLAEPSLILNKWREISPSVDSLHVRPVGRLLIPELAQDSMQPFYGAFEQESPKVNSLKIFCKWTNSVLEKGGKDRPSAALLAEWLEENQHEVVETIVRVGAGPLESTLETLKALICCAGDGYTPWSSQEWCKFALAANLLRRLRSTEPNLITLVVRVLLAPEISKEKTPPPPPLQWNYREHPVGPDTWQSFLNAATFLRCLSEKLKRTSPTYVVAGPPENLVTIPYRGIPALESLKQDIPVPIQETGPKYFELSSSIAHIVYEEGRDTIDISCLWPREESEEEFDRLLAKVLERRGFDCEDGAQGSR